MQVSIELTAATKQEIERLEAMPARLAQGVETGMRRAVNVAAGIVVKRSLSGGVLKRRTGALARSVKGRTEGSGFNIVGLVGVTKGPAARYAAILQDGGVIRMKSKRLAIPVGAALTPTGRPRYPGGPRTVPGLVLIKRPGRAPLLARPLGGGQIEVLFVLKTSVRIPGYHWLSKGMEAAVELVTRTIQGSVDAVLEAA